MQPSKEYSFFIDEGRPFFISETTSLPLKPAPDDGKPYIWNEIINDWVIIGAENEDESEKLSQNMVEEELIDQSEEFLYFKIEE